MKNKLIEQLEQITGKRVILKEDNSDNLSAEFNDAVLDLISEYSMKGLDPFKAYAVIAKLARGFDSRNNPFNKEDQSAMKEGFAV